MSNPSVLSPSARVFDPFALMHQTVTLSRKYQSNRPVPHIYLADFIDPELASAAANEFPHPDSDTWTHYQHQNENKHGMTKRSLFPPTIGQISDALNSEEFLQWLSNITGIAGLLADPLFEGGGLHQSGRGGFLNVHTDFSHHHYQKNWKRRINLILYLNESWRDEWGGAIELWDEHMHACSAKYSCGFNRAFIFNTDDKSFHGFPEPLTCPVGVSRKSLAFYYYTIEADAKTAVRSTNYRARPEDSVKKSALIWLDKQAVNLYSRAKAAFGFSDDTVSRLLHRREKETPDRNRDKSC